MNVKGVMNRRAMAVAGLVVLAAMSCDNPVCACSPPPTVARVVGTVADGAGPVAAADLRFGSGSLAACGATATVVFYGGGEAIADAQGRFAATLIDPGSVGSLCVRVRARRPAPPLDSVVMEGVAIRFGHDTGYGLDSTVLQVRFP